MVDVDLVAADVDNNTVVECADCYIAENVAFVDAYLIVVENGTLAGLCALDSGIEFYTVADSIDSEVTNSLNAELIYIVDC